MNKHLMLKSFLVTLALEVIAGCFYMERKPDPNINYQLIGCMNFCGVNNPECEHRCTQQYGIADDLEPVPTQSVIVIATPTPVDAHGCSDEDWIKTKTFTYAKSAADDAENTYRSAIESESNDRIKALAAIKDRDDLDAKMTRHEIDHVNEPDSEYYQRNASWLRQNQRDDWTAISSRCRAWLGRE